MHRTEAVKMIITDKATLRENEKYHTSESPHFLHYLCLVLNEYCSASPKFQGEHFIYITKTVSKTWAITRFGPRGFTWISARWNCAKDGWMEQRGRLPHEEQRTYPSAMLSGQDHWPRGGRSPSFLLDRIGQWWDQHWTGVLSLYSHIGTSFRYLPRSEPRRDISREERKFSVITPIYAAWVSDCCKKFWGTHSSGWIGKRLQY